jgi:hypothetical protein
MSRMSELDIERQRIAEMDNADIEQEYYLMASLSSKGVRDEIYISLVEQEASKRGLELNG